MDDHNKRPPNDNKGGGDRNRRNFNGLAILIGWALVLTVGLNYLSVYMDSAEEARTTCEIAYSEFKDLVREGVVDEVLFTDGQIRITTEEGYVYTDEEGNAYDKNFTLFTMQLNDPDLLQFLDDYDVEKYTAPYVPQMSPILEFMIGYILPVVLMVAIFSFFFRMMAKKGGLGGIGNVGKSNAKVYMEKSTGVTFKDVAGQDEAKESLEEIIDFLHNPAK